MAFAMVQKKSRDANAADRVDASGGTTPKRRLSSQAMNVRLMTQSIIEVETRPGSVLRWVFLFQ